VLGYVSIAMSEFLGMLVPALAEASAYVSRSALVIQVAPWATGTAWPLAIAVLVAFVGLQWAGVRISSRFQEWATAIKFLAFLAIVIAGLVLSGTGSSAAAPAAALASPSLAGVIGAVQVVVITYAGWQSALYFTEEDRDPVRNLPRAMIGGVVAVLVIYLLINLALLAILPVPELAGSKLAAADAARRLVGGRGGQIITALSLISLPPLLNAIMMIGTRILFALGRDRLLWSRTADVNAGGTPGVATLVTTVVAIGLIATGTFERLVAIAAFYLALNYAICCLALVALRRREPAVPRPFRAWGYPWSAGLVIAGALAFLVGALIGDTVVALAAVGLLAVGLIVHAVLRWLR